MSQKAGNSELPGRGDYLILGVLSLIWGSSFILIKMGLDYFTPMQVGALRIFIAAIAFIPITIYKRKQIDWKLWPYFLIVGLTGSGLPSFLFPLAQEELSSSIAGILNSLTPLFTLIIGAWIFHTKITYAKIFGVSIGLAGAIMLILIGDELALDEKLYYGFYILLATICYGTSVNVAKAKMNHVDPTLLMSTAFLFVLPFAVISLIWSGTHTAIIETPGIIKGIFFVGLLSLLATFYASILFYKMVQRTNPVFGSSVTYLIPIVGLFWGVLDGEAFGVFHVIGMGLILAGVYFSRK
jgi:drug/metabolite transporter (DMT)-like permease